MRSKGYWASVVKYKDVIFAALYYYEQLYDSSSLWSYSLKKVFTSNGLEDPFFKPLRKLIGKKFMVSRTACTYRFEILNETISVHKEI